MKVWHTSSTERRRDIKTRKITGTYICFESSGFFLKVPTNDEDYNEFSKKQKSIIPLMRKIKKLLVTP
jgi:hypothetical protein